MTAGTQEPGRPAWALTPLESVGPLRFGMSADEARAALPGACELGHFQAEPHYPQIVGVPFGLQSAAPAVVAYFTGAGRLFCVSADAARGPQVTLEGQELTGQVPGVLEQALLNASEPGRDVSYGPRGNPGINALGLVLRVQETGAGVRTRPVLVGREWADRCIDDWEGPIPESEWIGRQWPHPGWPDIWPPPESEPNWPHGWRPPF